MALLKKVDNLGCHVCWSPFKESKSVIAVGSKGSMTSFDDDRGELILYDVSTRYAGTKPVEMGRVKARSKFGSIAWGQCASHSQGLIAGGMSSGHVEIYDPSNLNSPIASIQAHKETVNALAFNPHASRSHILASGSSDGDVKIIDLHNPSNPQMCFPSNAQNDRHRGAVRSVQWNTKVDYIVASSSDDGSCIIWDLKRNKRWATLHAPRGSAFVDFAWHPSEGFQILTALADDSKPVVQVWDLRKSTTTPLGELQGHEKGLLSIDWSPQDPRLVVTSGQDNKTLMWDLQSGKSVYEIPSEEAAKPKVVQDTKQQDDRKSPTGEGNFWENGGVGSSQVASAVIGGKVRRITELSWSPHMPLVMAACTFDNKLEIFGMTTGACNTRRPPKWLGRRSGATFGFGGKLASVSGTNRNVEVRTVGSNSTVLKRTEEFEKIITSGDLASVCTKKSQNCSNRDAAVWDVMGILFDKDARRRLLGYLGFEPEQQEQQQQEEDKSSIPTTSSSSSSAQQQQQPPPQTTTTNFLAQSSGDGGDADDLFGGSSGGGGDLFDAPAPTTTNSRFDADDFFGEGPPLEQEEQKEEVLEKEEEEEIPIPPVRQQQPPQPPQAVHDTESDQQVKAAVMVGDFDLAVKKSLAKGNMADALLLAPFGSDDIFTRAREEYLRNQMRTRPFMRVILAILTKRLDLFVEESDLQKWRETLAVITSYAEQGQFPALCNALGDRILRADPSDSNGSAVVCYMCAFNGAKACELWERRASELAKSGGSDTGLQELIERISVFQAALREVNQNDQVFQKRIVSHFTSHVTLLAEQGRPDLALQCAKRFQISLGGADAELNEMVNRLEAMAVRPAPVVHQQQQQNFGGGQQQQNFGGGQQQQNFGGGQQQQNYNNNVPVAQAYPTTTTPVTSNTTPAQQQQNTSWSSFPASTTSAIPQDGFGTTDVPGGGTKYGNTSYLQNNNSNTMVAQQHQQQSYTPPHMTQTPGATSGQMTQIFDPSKVPSSNQMLQKQQPAKAPEPVAPKVLKPELKPIVDSFQNAVSRLKVTPLSSTESRQLKLVFTSIQRLHESLKNGQVDTATIQQLHVIANHVNTNNYDYVKHYYDHLVNTAWKANRLWLKDLKWFVQLGKKKLQQ